MLQGDTANENSGPIIFLGGLLLLITSILEFILGNTFPCVVFGTIGALVWPSSHCYRLFLLLIFIISQQAGSGLRSQLQ
jgi:succinate-acetate transporter protein